MLRKLWLLLLLMLVALAKRELKQVVPTFPSAVESTVGHAPNSVPTFLRSKQSGSMFRNLRQQKAPVLFYVPPASTISASMASIYIAHNASAATSNVALLLSESHMWHLYRLLCYSLNLTFAQRRRSFLKAKLSANAHSNEQARDVRAEQNVELAHQQSNSTSQFTNPTESSMQLGANQIFLSINGGATTQNETTAGGAPRDMEEWWLSYRIILNSRSGLLHLLLFACVTVSLLVLRLPPLTSRTLQDIRFRYEPVEKIIYERVANASRGLVIEQTVDSVGYPRAIPAQNESQDKNLRSVSMISGPRATMSLSGMNTNHSTMLANETGTSRASADIPSLNLRASQMANRCSGREMDLEKSESTKSHIHDTTPSPNEPLVDLNVGHDEDDAKLVVYPTLKLPHSDAHCEDAVRRETIASAVVNVLAQYRMCGEPSNIKPSPCSDASLDTRTMAVSTRRAACDKVRESTCGDSLKIRTAGTELGAAAAKARNRCRHPFRFGTDSTTKVKRANALSRSNVRLRRELKQVEAAWSTSQEMQSAIADQINTIEMLQSLVMSRKLECIWKRKSDSGALTFLEPVKFGPKCGSTNSMIYGRLPSYGESCQPNIKLQGGSVNNSWIH